MMGAIAASDEDDRPPYIVVENENRFDVRSLSDRTVMACSDSSSATHYAQMLSEAFEAGYKKGIRDR